jgi:hypothetical protein
VKVAKLKYDDTGVDFGGDGRPAPPEGIYEALVVEMKVEKNKAGTNDQLVVIAEIVGDEAHEGYRLWSYFPLPWKKTDAGAWKRAQFLNAVTGSVKGTIDTERVDELFSFKVKTKNEMWDEKLRAKIDTFIPMEDEEPVEDEEPEEDDPLAEEDEEVEEEAPKSRKPSRGRGKRTPEPEPEPEPEDDEDGDEVPPYPEWTLTELRDEAKDRDLDLGAVPKSAAKAKQHIIALLESDDEEAGEE